MKKLSFIIALMLMSIAGMAQDESKTSTKIGVRFGYNLSTIDEFWDFSNDYKDWKSGVNFGVVSDFNITQKIVFRPGLYYSSKGVKLLDDSKHRYNYLEAPLLVVFQQSVTENVKLELQAGMYLGVGVCGKKELPIYNDWGNFYKEDTFSDKGAKRFDCGLNIGCGLQISKIYLGVSYENGFMEIEDYNVTHCFMANVGYSF